MIAVDIPYWITHKHSDGPGWWHNFIGTVKLPEGYRDLPKHDRRAIWRQCVDHELIKHGGRLQPSYMTNRDTPDMLVTFRIDSNYTMFMLKFS